MTTTTKDHSASGDSEGEVMKAKTVVAMTRLNIVGIDNNGVVTA